MKRILFVCSNDNHVKMFEPIVQATKNIDPLFMSLDSVYHQNATQIISDFRLPFIKLDQKLHQNLYSFSKFFIIYFSLFKLRFEIISKLKEVKPKAIVLGNDRGIVEKLFIHYGKKFGFQTFLFQDGLLEMKRENGRKRSPKIIISEILHRTSLWYIASNDFGFSKVDTFFVLGKIYKDYFQKYLANKDIKVVGQPRYDSIKRKDKLIENKQLNIAFFPSALKLYYGEESHELQLKEILDIYSIIGNNKDINMIVKLHPRDKIEDYKILEDKKIQLVTDMDNIEFINQIDVAISSFSTSLIEASIANNACIITNLNFEGTDLHKIIPTYLPFNLIKTKSELAELIEKIKEYQNYNNLVEEQLLNLNQIIEIKEANVSKNAADYILSRLK